MPGLVGVLSIFGALMFYQEHSDISNTSLGIVALGCAGKLAGIGILVHGRHGTLQPPKTAEERRIHEASAGMRSANTFRVRQGLRGAWRHAMFIQKLVDGQITEEVRVACALASLCAVPASLCCGVSLRCGVPHARVS